MDSFDSSDGSGNVEIKIDEIFVREDSGDSSSVPQEEWSSLQLIPQYSEPNVKFELYAQGLFDPGSGEICTKYIRMSDSSVLRHPYYNYPCIKDPGIVDALTSVDDKKIYSMDGQELYLDVCKEMKTAPIRIFYDDLLTDAIDLSYYGVSEKGMRAICIALTYNQTVRRIDFTSNFLSHDACYHLGQLLGENHTIAEIVLNQCNLGMEGLRRVLQNLHARNTELLDVSNNDLGDDGFLVLIESMTKGAIIKRLNVANNNLGVKSANEFEEVLDLNNHFTHIDLSWNQLGVVRSGSGKLLKALSESEYLVDLNVAFNYIHNTDVIQLLMRADCLENLNLSKNNLQSDAVKYIVNGFRRSKLQRINLSRNPFTPADALAIVQGFQQWSEAKKLLMDDIDVEPEFVEVVAEVKQQNGASVTHGRIIRDFSIKGADMRDIILKRLNVISRSKSIKKPKLDFCVYFLTLERKGITAIEPKMVMRALKEGSVIADEDLLDSLCSSFPGPLLGKGEKTIKVSAACDYIRRLFPEKQPEPPTPEPEPEPAPVSKKGKGKGGKGKGSKGKKK